MKKLSTHIQAYPNTPTLRQSELHTNTHRHTHTHMTASGNFICRSALTQLKFLLHTFKQFVCNSSCQKKNKNGKKIQKSQGKALKIIHPAFLFTKAAPPHVPSLDHSQKKTWTRFILMHFLLFVFVLFFLFFAHTTQFGWDFFRKDWHKLVHTFRGIFSFCSLFVMKAELGSKSCDHNLAPSSNCHSPFSGGKSFPPPPPPRIYIYINRGLSLDQRSPENKLIKNKK